MTATRLTIIRLVVMIVIVCATFAMGWYMYMRFAQLREQEEGESGTIELNNPRLNHTLVEKVIKDFESRKTYSENDQVTITTVEKDPFYE